MTIGERLKEERQLIGLNQTDMAGQCGVTKNTQLAYEKGERSPDANYLAAAAEKGVDVLYVVTGERRPQRVDSITADEADFLEFYRLVSESDKNVLSRTAYALAKAAGPKWMK
ncbi:helix-turn-helix domain-containing protein [Pseudomonas sp. H9]|uniref:helix-turn-helix domain-containing protein n=1 Tax=Pseudomonas sp. H9 TaxID=483968 RepID=UPI001057FE32|nr:helix-turn-helix transcriptional regulator [Pseudomonas sp. H9]TDF86312.1 XRE family transcriptional regulator [Pseudomonas sp. H9]